MSLEESIELLIKPLIESLEFKFVGCEYIRERQPILRIYIDNENGITVDDCAVVSRHVGALLDVEDPIDEPYLLEISSPGLDRPLFKLADFEQFINEEITILLRIPLNDRRKWTGTIKKVENQNIIVNIDGKDESFVFSNIKKANLVPKF